MAVIVTFEKSRRLWHREPLVYGHRDPGVWTLFLPWWAITVHRGGWWPQPFGKAPDGPEKATSDAA
jgi:hypothetical protein